MTPKISTPHDVYFQGMMEISAVAESFFKAHLPSKVTLALEWSSLRIEDSVRRTPQKKPSCTDITYTCQIRNEDCPVYLHVEQERNVDPSIVERIIQYNLGLFIKHRKQKKDKLPIIANFVLYNGSSRNYPYHKSPYDYFGVPWIARLLMGNFFGLINLNKVTDWALFHQGLSGVMELLLKKADDIHFVEWMKKEGSSIEIEGGEFLKDIVSLSTTYALQVGKGKAEEILGAFSSIYPNLETTIMTAAQQLEERGIRQGIYSIAQSMLRDRESIDKIQKWTGLTREEIYGSES